MLECVRSAREGKGRRDATTTQNDRTSAYSWVPTKRMSRQTQKNSTHHDCIRTTRLLLGFAKYKEP